MCEYTGILIISKSMQPHIKVSTHKFKCNLMALEPGQMLSFFVSFNTINLLTRLAHIHGDNIQSHNVIYLKTGNILEIIPSN